jgi:hypothetical protein
MNFDALPADNPSKGLRLRRPFATGKEFDMLRFTAFAALAVGMAAAAPPASAQSCGDRDDMIGQLGERHHEKLMAAGLHDPQHLVELWATEDGATWTLLISRADGYTCVLGAGSGWTGYAGPQALAGIEG